MERSAQARYGTALFWIVAGVMHFVIPRTYEAIVPPSLRRWKRELVIASGVAELAGGLAVLSRRHSAAGALVAARDAGRGLPGQRAHGAAPRGVQAHPRARALGAAAGAGPVRAAHLARHALRVAPRDNSGWSPARSGGRLDGVNVYDAIGGPQ